MTVTSLIMSSAVFMTSCGLVSEFNDKVYEKYDEKYQELVDDHAEDYDIDPDGVEVSQGGQYFRVPIDTIYSYDDLDEYIILYRKWLRFANEEFKTQYYVGFFDKDHPDIWYGGFSNQDHGYDGEYYWADRDILLNTVERIAGYTKTDDKYSDMTPEEFYEITGLDEDDGDEFRDIYYENYPSRKDVEIDEDDYYYVFIPGDTINHREKFVIGDKDCEIEPGTYYVDLPNSRGVIHITDDDGDFKYRLDASYRDGHYDDLYEYSELPAKVKLKKGDIMYITNCTATFEEAD